MTFLESLHGAGPYISVFIGLVAALAWAMKDRSRVLAGWESSTERLLSERETRARESLEVARLLAASNQRLVEHTKILEKVLDRWSLS